MTLQEAKNILGDRARWELLNMKKALSMFPILNSKEENLRLEAVKIMLRSMPKTNPCSKNPSSIQKETLVKKYKMGGKLFNIAGDYRITKQLMRDGNIYWVRIHEFKDGRLIASTSASGYTKSKEEAISVFNKINENNYKKYLGYAENPKPTSAEEAQKHCQDPKTSGTLKDGTRWFDGYNEIKKNPRRDKNPHYYAYMVKFYDVHGKWFSTATSPRITQPRWDDIYYGTVERVGTIQSNIEAHYKRFGANISYKVFDSQDGRDITSIANREINRVKRGYQNNNPRKSSKPTPAQASFLAKLRAMKNPCKNKYDGAVSATKPHPVYAQGKKRAYLVLQNHKDDKGWVVLLAVYGEKGYYTTTGRIQGTFDQAEAKVNLANKEDFGLSVIESWKIVASSMFPKK